MQLLVPILATTTLATQIPLSLFDTERAFAQMAQERGVSPAFSAFLAPDGVVLRPQPTSGHAVHDGQPDDGTRLHWEPVFVEIAASGDLGWTTGPWTWRKQTADPIGAHGHFVSVWRKQGDGTWKVALDVGISHAEPPATPLSQAPQVKGNPLSQADQNRARTRLLEAEAGFNALASAQGQKAALEAFGAEDLRTYRAGLLPARSKRASLALVAFDEVSTHSEVQGSGLSAAGDLGYAYGLATSRPAPDAEPLPCAFARIWRRVGEDWRLVLDLQIPAAAK